MRQCELRELTVPAFSMDNTPVFLEDETMKERTAKVLTLMKARNLDAVVIYADLEHGSNFEYLTGFLPRFEEAMLVLHKNGDAYLLLGNENTKMAAYSRLRATLIHVPFFSLPNQPMQGEKPFVEYLQDAKLTALMQIGVIGWKNFTSTVMKNPTLFDLPHYIVEALTQLCPHSIENHCDMMIGGKEGARIQNNANEIAHYEVLSSLASNAFMQALDHIEIGMSEMEIASYMNVYGQRHSVVSVCATGDRFDKANLYPSAKRVRLGDKMSITVGLKGGLSSRAGYAVKHQEQLDENVKDYIEKLCAPYFATITTWLETIHVGMKGEELYELVETILPKDTYHWTLNPGHLLQEEEWMSSPIYPNSKETLKSGMLLQSDIIPSMKGYGGASCESGIALADKALREQIQKEYPALWERFEKRRAYMEQVLHIAVHEDVLLMNDTVAYYRPFFLNRRLAFTMKR